MGGQAGRVALSAGVRPQWGDVLETQATRLLARPACLTLPPDWQRHGERNALTGLVGVYHSVPDHPTYSPAIEFVCLCRTAFILLRYLKTLRAPVPDHKLPSLFPSQRIIQ